MNQKTRRRNMNKNEIEGIEKVIKGYLKKNLRIESRLNISMSIAHPRTIWMFTLERKRFKKFHFMN